MTRTNRVLLVAWLCQPLYLVAELLVAGLATERYSLRRDTISALGVGCPPGGSGACSSAPTAMNTAFVVFGLLMTIGATAGVLRRAAEGALPRAADGALPPAAEGALPPAAEGALPLGADGALRLGADGALPRAADGALPLGADGALPRAAGGAQRLGADGGGPGRRHRVLVALWVLAGLSSVAVGLVPLSRGEGPHAVAATPVFAVQPVAMLLGAALLPRVLAGGGWRRWARPVALGLGVLAAVGTVAFVLPLGDPDWSGAAERLALWPAKLWLALVAALAWRARPAGGLVSRS